MYLTIEVKLGTAQIYLQCRINKYTIYYILCIYLELVLANCLLDHVNSLYGAFLLILRTNICSSI